MIDDSALPGETESNRRAIWEDMARILAELHKIDVKAVGLEAHGKSGSMAQRQVPLMLGGSDHHQCSAR